jgi:hypothetical protein
VIAERAPRVRHLGLELHGASQAATRLRRAPDPSVSPSSYVRRPVRLRLCERFEDSCDAAASPQRRCATPSKSVASGARRDLQDFRCLFGREPRLRGHQALRVSERGFERSDRF